MTNETSESDVFLADEQATDRLGAACAELLPERCLVTLTGPLGAGKTRFVRAVAGGCGIDPAEVTSPTFVLCHEYAGDRLIYHLDAYRLDNGEALLAIGFDEYLADRAVTFLEWPSRVETALPPDRLDVTITPVAGTARRVDLTARGRFPGSVVSAVRRRMDDFLAKEGGG